MIFRQVWVNFSGSSIAITVLDGEYGRICAKSRVRSIYDTSSSRKSMNDKDSVGDDLELFYEQIMSSVLLTEHRSDEVQKTFLFQKLTNSNIGQIGPFVRSRRLAHGSRKTRRKFRHKKNENKNDDREDKFIQNDCSRMTFFILNAGPVVTAV